MNYGHRPCSDRVVIQIYGFLFQNAESWQKILLITGTVHLFMIIMYSIFGSGNQQEWGHPVYEKLVKPKKEPQKKYGSTSQTSDKVEMNGTLTNGCPSKKGIGSI